MKPFSVCPVVLSSPSVSELALSTYRQHDTHYTKIIEMVATNLVASSLGLTLLLLSARNLQQFNTWQRRELATSFRTDAGNDGGRDGLRKQSRKNIRISIRDETGGTGYYDNKNARIVVEDKGGNVQILVDATTDFVGKDTNKKREERLGRKCPAIIRNKVGLFDAGKSNSTVKDDFGDTILLVASNYAYYNMLQNWEFLATELNLQWAVLALDDKLYKELGPSRAIPPETDFSVSGAHHWGKGNFKGITCNKIRMALQVATSCNVNVVFTDADNVFFKNPFEHDFGRLIKSKKFDYLYQPNHPALKPLHDQCLHGNPRKEANTGFYYFNYESNIYQSIADSTLERCQDPKNKKDDQSTFWEEFWKVERKLKGAEDSHPFQHCALPEYENPDLVPEVQNAAGNKNIFRYCCIDPYYYPIGDHSKRKGPSNRDPITYHANYAKTYGKKVEKLVYARSDKYGWDMSRFKDGIGGLLKYDNDTTNTHISYTV